MHNVAVIIVVHNAKFHNLSSMLIYLNEKMADSDIIIVVNVIVRPSPAEVEFLFPSIQMQDVKK